MGSIVNAAQARFLFGVCDFGGCRVMGAAPFVTVVAVNACVARPAVWAARRALLYV